MAPEILPGIPQLNNKIDRYIQRPLEQIDNVCRHFLDNEGIYAWLETDLKAEFERRPQDTQHILRGIQECRSTQDSFRASIEVRDLRVPVDTIRC